MAVRRRKNPHPRRRRAPAWSSWPVSVACLFEHATFHYFIQLSCISAYFYSYVPGTNALVLYVLIVHEVFLCTFLIIQVEVVEVVWEGGLLKRRQPGTCVQWSHDVMHCLPPYSSDRLPSVRPKRDLTLGGVPKVSTMMHCTTYKNEACHFFAS